MKWNIKNETWEGLNIIDNSVIHYYLYEKAIIYIKILITDKKMQSYANITYPNPSIYPNV